MHPAHWMSLQMGASLPNDRCVLTALAGLPGRCLAHADGYFFQCHRNLKLTRQVEIAEFVYIAQAFIGHELHILTARNVLFVLMRFPFLFTLCGLKQKLVIAVQMINAGRTAGRTKLWPRNQRVGAPDRAIGSLVLVD